MNIEIEKRKSEIPNRWTPKPYSMIIKVPIHNYMMSKRVRDPPYIMLSKDELKDIAKRIKQLLDEEEDE